MANPPELTMLENNTPADATDVMYNFNALKSFMTTEVAHKDGATMSGPLYLPAGNPPSTNSGRAAAHKAYVDSQREVAKTYADTQIDTATTGCFVHLTSWADGDYDIDGDPAQAQPAGGNNGYDGWVNIKFDHTVADIGNGYDQTYDRFVAPKAGIYMVSVTAGGSANTKFSTRIVVGPAAATNPADHDNRIYYGPRWDPSDVTGSGGAGPMSFTHVVKVDAAGWWIRPQFHAADEDDYRFGKTLTIAWLHPNA